jgi:hypothetical protein
MPGNKTSRQDAKSATGRQKVAEWLKDPKNQSEKQPGIADIITPSGATVRQKARSTD